MKKASHACFSTVVIVISTYAEKKEMFSDIDAFVSTCIIVFDEENLKLLLSKRVVLINIFVSLKKL